MTGQQHDADAVFLRSFSRSWGSEGFWLPLRQQLTSCPIPQAANVCARSGFCDFDMPQDLP